MKEIVHNLLGELSSYHGGENESILQIAGLLEQSSWEHGSDLLPPELHEVRLTQDEQSEIVRHLALLIGKSDGDMSNLIWAIGKATPKASIDALLGIIQSGREFNSHETYQLLIGLDNTLSGRKVLPYASQTLKKIYPHVFFDNVQKGTNDDAKKILSRILYRLSNK